MLLAEQDYPLNLPTAKLGRMLSRDDLGRLRSDLQAADYTLTGVSERLGEAALAALGRNTTLAAQRSLADATDPQADAIRLWLLQQPIPRARLGHWQSLAGLLAAGLLREAADGSEVVRATVELKPHGSDRRQGWICSDRTPLDGASLVPRSDFVLGASPASTTLTQLVPPGHYHRVLDLGTGCGIQALHLAADEIIATDLNPRALELAAISLGLSGVSAELRLGSLYQPVADDRFDLIVTNPPYVISPPSSDRLIYRETEFTGDDLMRQVVSGAARHLNPDGILVVLGNWAIGADGWTDRLATWIPADCDAFVLQRERLDPYEYIELWLADAGLVGSPDYATRYDQWLSYFETQGIEAVGMGWLFLRRAGRQPSRRFEEWPHSVVQPVGQAVKDHFAAITLAAEPADRFLAASWRLHPGVIQETIGEPGASDPNHLVLRQQFGFGRAVETDTALAAVLGACDGDLPLGVLVSAVARLLDVPAAELQTELLPKLRNAVREGYLLLADTGFTGSGQPRH